ncbi:MAG: VPLPA-CTERM sorting domain-containing protein [Pseudomonadota bacterium]
MNFLQASISAGALLLSVGAVSAGTVNFGLPGDVTSGIGSATGTFDAGFLSGSLTADAGVFGNPSLTQDATNGLGISAGFFDSDPAIEGQGRNETLTVSFDSVATILGITAGFVDSLDEWTITVFGTGGDQTFSASAASTGPSPYTLGFGTGIEATGFEIFADGGVCEARGLFGICTDFNEHDVSLHSFEVAPVPLPAAGWMLLAGVGGLFAARRRKNA